MRYSSAIRSCLSVSGYEAGRPHLMPATVPVSSTQVVADSLVLRSVDSAVESVRPTRPR